MSDPKRWLDDHRAEDEDALRLVRLGKTLGPRPGSAERAWPEFLAISDGFPPDTPGADGAGAPPDPSAAGAAVSSGATGSAATAAATSTSASITAASLVKTLLLGAALGAGGVLGSHLVGRSLDAPSVSPSPSPVQVQDQTSRTTAAEHPALPEAHAPPPSSARGAPSAIPSSATPGAPAASPVFAEPRPAPAATGVVSFPSETGVTSFPTDPERASLLQREAREIAEARALLGQGRPGDALALLRASAGRFQGGTLGQEREALTIEALASTGQRDTARERARAFVARFPKSPLVQWVRGFTGE